MRVKEQVMRRKFFLFNMLYFSAPFIFSSQWCETVLQVEMVSFPLRYLSQTRPKIVNGKEQDLVSNRGTDTRLLVCTLNNIELFERITSKAMSSSYIVEQLPFYFLYP